MALDAPKSMQRVKYYNKEIFTIKLLIIINDNLNIYVTLSETNKVMHNNSFSCKMILLDI